MGDQIVNELIQTLPALLNELGVKVAKKLLSGQSQIGVRKQFLHLKKTQTEKKKDLQICACFSFVVVLYKSDQQQQQHPH